MLDPDQPLPMTMSGHVTSSYASTALGRPIAMAVVTGGHGRMGQTVHIPMPGRTIKATITSTNFYDPDGERLKA